MKVKSKKWIERNKLNEWRWKVIDRDKSMCQICKKILLHPTIHHIIPKHFEEFRYDVDNGIVLCFNHHKVGKYSPHQNPVWFCNWLIKNKKELFDIAFLRMVEKLDRYKVEVECPFCKKENKYENYFFKPNTWYKDYMMCRECGMRYNILKPI